MSLEKLNSYQITPLNLKYTSQKKIQGTVSPQDVLLSNFSNFINSINKPLVIDMVCDYEELLFHKTVKMCSFDKVIFSSPDNLENILHANNMQFKKSTTREWVLSKEHPEYVILHDGLYAKLYTATNIHSDLPPGWIYGLYQMADFVRIFITPINNEKYDKTINSHKSVQATKSSTDEMNQSNDILSIKQVVKNDKTENLFYITIIAGIISTSKESLLKRQKEFEELDRNAKTEMYSLKYGQKKLLYGMGQKFLTVKSSMYAFVPFLTSELYEDGGFLLGENIDTLHPIQWNPNNRLNRNLVLAATSGSGKTTLAMMIIHAFEKMYPESFIFGIDPESEYKALGDNMGFHYIDYSQGQKMGFDTFKLLPDTITAAETLCDVLNVPEFDRALPMLAASKMSTLPIKDRSFFRFYDILKELEEKQLRKTQSSAYFEIMNNPPYSHLFQGEAPKNKKMILSLKNMGSPGSTTHRIITQIALNYAMSKCIMMPKIIPKLIMLDEVWMLLQHKSLGNTIANISRRGRKYNVLLMMATQNIEDMTGNDAARNVLVNSDTVMFLRQSEVTAKSLLEHFVLSDEEIKLLLSLNKGQALIKYGNDAIPANILPDKSQLELFRPK